MLDNSNIITALIEYSSKHRYKGFATFLLSGLVKYGLLIIGLGITIIMSYLLVKEKISEKGK